MASVGRMVPGQSSEWLEREHRTRYEFASTFARGCSVLDVACGMGYAAPMFIESGAKHYIGVDIDEGAVTSAAKRYRLDDRINFYVGDACALADVEDQSCDLIVSFETIEHVPQPDAFLRSVRRVIRPNGTFIVSTPNRPRYSPGNGLSSKPWNRYHICEWNAQEFQTLLDPCFRITKALGQSPIPQWKARTIHLAARYGLLDTLASVSQRLKGKKQPVSLNQDLTQGAGLEVQPISAWDSPLYIICVAKPR